MDFIRFLQRIEWGIVLKPTLSFWSWGIFFGILAGTTGIRFVWWENIVCVELMYFGFVLFCIAIALPIVYLKQKAKCDQ